LTQSNIQRILCIHVYKVRTCFLGQFLDILQTKGDNGVQKYIDVLEYDYPHVYKLITNKDAKDPPRGMLTAFKTLSKITSFCGKISVIFIFLSLDLTKSYC